MSNLTLQEAIDACIGYVAGESYYDEAQNKFIEKDSARPLAVAYEITEAGHHRPELGMPDSLKKMRHRGLIEALRDGSIVAFAKKVPIENESQKKVKISTELWDYLQIEEGHELLVGEGQKFCRPEFRVDHKVARKPGSAGRRSRREDITLLFEELLDNFLPDTAQGTIAEEVRRLAVSRFGTDKGFDKTTIIQTLRDMGKFNQLKNKE